MISSKKERRGAFHSVRKIAMICNSVVRSSTGTIAIIVSRDCGQKTDRAVLQMKVSA